MSLEYKQFAAEERVKQRKLHPEYSGTTITAIVNEEWKIYKKRSASATALSGGGVEPCGKKKSPFYVFLAEEKERIRPLYPGLSNGELGKIATNTWNTTKGSGTRITCRSGTMTYEGKRTLISRVPQFDLSGYEEIQTMLYRKRCIYCDAPMKKKYTKDTGDHIFPVQPKTTHLPVLHNFSAFTVPCCSACNNAHNNKPIEEFLSDPKYQANIDWFNMLFDIVDANIEHYYVPEDLYNYEVKKMQYDMERYRQSMESMPIFKRQG